jgi:hypothetical protein
MKMVLLYNITRLETTHDYTTRDKTSQSNISQADDILGHYSPTVMAHPCLQNVTVS